MPQTTPSFDRDAAIEARSRAGLTYEEVARRADLSVMTVWRTFAGRTAPTLRVQVAIARGLGVEVESLWHGGDGSRVREGAAETTATATTGGDSHARPESC